MNAQLRPLRRLLHHLDLPWMAWAVAGALTLAETGFALWLPMLTRDLVDMAATGTLPRRLLGIMVVVLLVQAAASGVSLYLLSRAGEQMTADLRRRLFSRLLRLPMSFHDERESGELVSRTISDTTAVESLLSQEVIAFVAGIVSMIGAVVILWLLDWRLTLVLFLTVLAGVLLVVPVAARLQAVGKGIQDAQADFSARLAGVLGEMRLLKSSSAERHEDEAAAGAVERLRRLGVVEAKVLAVLGPVSTLAISGALVLILGYGGMRVGDGSLAVGTLVAFILYLFQVLLPMIHLSTFFAAVAKAAGAAENLVGLLDEAEEDRVADGGQVTAPAAVRFENVVFGYGADRPVIDGLELEIPAGRVTALVGPSGSGKTTVASLLERFYSPTSGRIVHGDTPIEGLALEPWRRRIGYVAQEAPLRSGTVRTNLVYGLEREVPEQRLFEVLRAARADLFVRGLPKGLDTEVGERGVRLSGGQRQRLAIARAFLTDPEILILDEATANLDAESEQAVRDALDELMRGRTTLIIAHRLATVVGADQIAVVEGGQVTGRGNHRELLASHELYRRLVERQRVNIEPEAAAVF